MSRKSNEEAVEVLKQLGLTYCQARIYLVLVKLGASPVKIISKISGVARAEVYRTMPALQKLGLAEKILGIPISFKATPLQDGINILMKQKNSKHTELQKKAMKLVNNFTASKETELTEEGAEFVIIPEGTIHKLWVLKRRATTQTNIDVFVTREVFKFEINNNFEDIKNLLEKGVTIRYIVYTLQEANDAIKLVPYLSEASNFHVRYTSTVPLVATLVFDNKEAVFSNPTSNLLSGPKLWSNNPHFIALLKNYFETVWKAATEYNNEER
jgi:sugar-specific transcriptional regulator TrmB